jgi:formate dehydrogenase subunit gamma
MEGAFEAMGTGEVDMSWAEEHHDVWLAEALAKERSAEPPRQPAPAPAK